MIEPAGELVTSTMSDTLIYILVGFVIAQLGVAIGHWTSRD